MVRRASERRLTLLGDKVTTETNSVRTVEIFREHPADFDLVLTDYSMPHLSRLDLVRALLLVRPDTPIAMVTGFTDGLSAEDAKAVGVRLLLKKPVTSSDLAETVRQLLAGPAVH